MSHAPGEERSACVGYHRREKGSPLQFLKWNDNYLSDVCATERRAILQARFSRFFGTENAGSIVPAVLPLLLRLVTV